MEVQFFSMEEICEQIRGGNNDRSFYKDNLVKINNLARREWIEPAGMPRPLSFSHYIVLMRYRVAYVNWLWRFLKVLSLELTFNVEFI